MIGRRVSVGRRGPGLCIAGAGQQFRSRGHRARAQCAPSTPRANGDPADRNFRRSQFLQSSSVLATDDLKMTLRGHSGIKSLIFTS